MPSRHPVTARSQAAAGPSRLPRWTGALTADLALATRAEPFSAPGWIFELKYDGFRLLAAKDGDSATLRYRSGRNATPVFPEVVAALAALPARRALLDGELVVFGNDGRSDFELLRARALGGGGAGAARMDVRACLFDLLALDDQDLRQLPVVERKRLLRELLAEAGDRLVFVEHVEERGEELLAGASELRLEGIVAKRADSAYVAGHSGLWRKFKVEETADFVVIGIAAPSEGTFWKPALVLGSADRVGVRYIGRVAIGEAELDGLGRRRSAAPARLTALPRSRASRDVARPGDRLRGAVPRFEPARSAAPRLPAVQAGQGVARLRGES